MSKTYEFINKSNKKDVIDRFREKLEREFPVRILMEYGQTIENLEETILKIDSELDRETKILFEALIILLDLGKNQITSDLIQKKFFCLVKIIEGLSFSHKAIKVDFSDARQLPIHNNIVDFVITSPPYINVFNYHQNYRKSVEILGWDVLKIAKSEIGSNRANRGNRFYTVVQYCLDMADVLQELSRVSKKFARIILIVGYESKVLGVPFNNADIIERIGIASGLYEKILRQKREFKNKFGKIIREDILNFSNLKNCHTDISSIARNVALDVLEKSIGQVSPKNHTYLEDTIEKVFDIGKTKILNPKENIYQFEKIELKSASLPLLLHCSKTMPELPQPHYTKLIACLNNPRLPSADRDRVEEAIKKYHEWIEELKLVECGQINSIQKLVDATNRYKKFVELDLIFDSSKNFLYRQKGQLKLDNTILEEFLPHLMFRSLRGIDESFELGPKKTFSGLSFSSSIGDLGDAGKPSIRSKDQDFILGKKLYLKTSFEPNFQQYQLIESHLGYICAECKTNLDKTMFQEAVATSRDLKIAVPGSLYFLICEFLDMKPVSIVSTQIDDVLIVRKSKRMSANLRQEYKTPEARYIHRSEYEEFLDSSKYYADVFQRMIDKIQTIIDDSSPSIDRVLDRGHF
ncbi:Bpu10I family restriction endonuclease [Spirulina sp. 06S082]|uniref:Bpu10I family restriction endonuclease n=1 Tax=Spirulina sp. 06S082 TaxID=3110248 RepID=UPI002B2074FB|nr:Bpu10I family restriction endonuclease [Spirulina sp. 06S082]MEA5467347.1 Bpu10I family restriction endonuclease [Spirulina sp. 06S082]